MTKYIDRAVLMGKLTAADELKKVRNMTGEEAYSESLFFINDMPGADVEKVVRCKDCKHYAMWADGRAMNHCDRHDRTAYDNDFCSCGERKSDTQPKEKV